VNFFERLGFQRPPRTPQDADKLALKHLEKRGADLSLPRHVIHFLLFAREDDAHEVAAQLDGGTWTAQAESPTTAAEKWVVRVDGHRIVGRETIAAFRAQFEEVAAAHDGEYDGWEAAAKP
jgi:hypothetical protein